MKTNPSIATGIPWAGMVGIGNPARSLTGPDLVTGLRPLCGVGVWVALLAETTPLALFLLLLGGLTDFVDGWWARRLPASAHGAAWDGLADRLFFYLVALGLWHAGYLPAWAHGFVLLWFLAEVGAAGIIRRRSGRNYLDLEHLPAAKWFATNACALGAALMLEQSTLIGVLGFSQVLGLGWLVTAYFFHSKGNP
jgi:phosphatidylglycerophosphate synthase